jgi:hypothetical protein
MKNGTHASPLITGPTGWIWATDGETFGLSIDLETRTLRWFVNAGCLCDHDDSTVDQTPAAFLEQGVPGAVALPDEVQLAEMRAAARALQNRRSSPPAD